MSDFGNKLSVYSVVTAAILLMWLLPAMAESTGVITGIRFSGNKTTQPRIMLQEMVIRAGDPIDPERIERSRQAIMDLGLFKSVDAVLVPEPAGAVLEITVSEKYYILPVPKLDRSADGEVSYGGQLKLYNLWGLNQKLDVVYKAERGCCESDRKVSTYSVEYTYPRLAGTGLGLGLDLGHKVIPRAILDPLGEPISEYDDTLDSFAAEVTHWLGRGGPSAGWSVGLSGFWRSRSYLLTKGDPLELKPARAVGVEFSVKYSKIHDLLYSRDGVEFGISSEHGLEGMGSDAPYSRNQLYYRQYRPVGETPYTNLDLQVKLGVTGGDIPISDTPYSLGGSRELRGYEKGSIDGRSFFLVNLEYLRPLFGYPAARGVLFLDLGNAYPDNRLVDLSDINTSVGFGLRYKFKAFVNLQLRADLAYAFGLSDHRFYIGAKDTF